MLQIATNYFVSVDPLCTYCVRACTEMLYVLQPGHIVYLHIAGKYTFAYEDLHPVKI